MASVLRSRRATRDPPENTCKRVGSAVELSVPNGGQPVARGQCESLLRKTLSGRLGEFPEVLDHAPHVAGIKWRVINSRNRRLTFTGPGRTSVFARRTNERLAIEVTDVERVVTVRAMHCSDIDGRR
jgi:hypothetical protein